MQFWSKDDGIPVTNNNIVSILQMLNGASPAQNPLWLPDRLITAFSCCSLFVENRERTRARKVVAVEHFEIIQLHKQLVNKQRNQVSLMFTVSIPFASREELYETFTRVCMMLSRKDGSLALVYRTSAPLPSLLEKSSLRLLFTSVGCCRTKTVLWGRCI